jgi:GNAT superfamily N-acetyltransferase
MELKLFDDYHIAWADNPEEFQDFLHTHFPQVFAQHQQGVQLRDLLSDAEKERFRHLHTQFGNPGMIRLFLMHRTERIGWFMGHQENPDTFNMMNTGILPSHQGKGVYKAFLARLLEHLQAEGYQKVSSRHVATHNGIIIPKLQAGFVITGMELNEVHGWLVHLSYYFNAGRKDALMKRAGRVD